MTRLIVSGRLKEGERINTTKEEGHYLVNVLRLGRGGRVTVVDGDGNEFSAAIGKVASRAVELDIVKKLPPREESTPKIHLFAGLLKGKKMERVVTDAVELGVVSITPFISSRTVPKSLSGEKLSRLRKISREQSRLSIRKAVPEVSPPISYSEALDRASGERLIFYEGGGSNFPETETKDKDVPDVVSLFTGPEGGFSEEEIGLAVSSGFHVIGLGARILRAESAPGVAVAIVQYEWGDLKGR
jgi:16S rRNA (uracil1498-N3)-methyltransferase